MDQAGELFNSGKYAEAIPLYRGIVENDPADLNAWQSLVMCLRNTHAYEDGVETAKTALKTYTRSAWLWRELGNMLIKDDHFDEAQMALDQAKRIEPESEWLWRYLSQLHKARKQPALEARALEELVELEKASADDLNRLGIIHHNNKNYGRAIEYYRASAVNRDWTAPYFNMGLVYNDPEVSQDVDAADAYRRALLINATYQKARAELESTKAKLIPLATRARSQAVDLIRLDVCYQHYINPFEVLQLNPLDDYDEVDPKAIHRAKKRLLQELELNDGKVAWLEDQAMDRSRILSIDDELLDPSKRDYHLAVARNKPLLRFLTHGEVDHFLYTDDYFPINSLDFLDDDDGFRAFLSKPFAAQYNTVLTKAIASRALAVVEVLFDGRRWVEPEDVDLCLAGAYKQVGQLVETMEQLASKSEDRLVELPEVQHALSRHDIPGLFNLLPVQFRTQQTEVVSLLRSMAINCHNKHGETVMSKGILLLCKKFQFKSHELNERLKEDYEQVDKLIAENQVADRAIRHNNQEISRILNAAATDASIRVDPEPRGRPHTQPFVRVAMSWLWVTALVALLTTFAVGLHAGIWVFLLGAIIIGGIVLAWRIYHAAVDPTTQPTKKTTRELNHGRKPTSNPPYNISDRTNYWVAGIAVVFLGGVMVCNKPADYAEKHDTSISPEDPAPQASRPSGEVHFPKPSQSASGQETWSLPAEAELVKDSPPKPGDKYKAGGVVNSPASADKKDPLDILKDETWEPVAYSNGQAPECYNYSPRYDRKLDNELRVTVGGGTDVVIKVMQVNAVCIRYVYINSGTTYSIRNIPEGQYYMKIAYGKRWVEKQEAGMCIGKFASNPLYEKGEDILDFRTRHTGISYQNGQQYENFEIPSYEIKLDVVSNGFLSNNLNTDGISEAEFNQ
ncbi:MAG: hypothetical protein JSS77_12605 [Acidobacteria bacterium]|nr:hypothetical protein [Acidobacteriota bacterium]